jgi:hypothetical protein
MCDWVSLDAGRRVAKRDVARQVLGRPSVHSMVWSTPYARYMLRAILILSPQAIQLPESSRNGPHHVPRSSNTCLHAHHSAHFPCPVPRVLLGGGLDSPGTSRASRGSPDGMSRE